MQSRFLPTCYRITDGYGKIGVWCDTPLFSTLGIICIVLGIIFVFYCSYQQTAVFQLVSMIGCYECRFISPSAECSLLVICSVFFWRQRGSKIWYRQCLEGQLINFVSHKCFLTVLCFLFRSRYKNFSRQQSSGMLMSHLVFRMSRQNLPKRLFLHSIVISERGLPVPAPFSY